MVAEKCLLRVLAFSVRFKVKQIRTILAVRSPRRIISRSDDSEPDSSYTMCSNRSMSYGRRAASLAVNVHSEQVKG
ncbi:hypothetical protein M5K25_010854 [Dendrobium thyrsiflorum]|uniref:Uncharacterized protein n=1 Tax=Dendrobium thyrsiflorum TaxID=117978 RepID=A0ABD0V0Q4_DENTH